MDDSLKERWKEIVNESPGIRHISVPCYVGNTPSELLYFCDASGKAYALAIYLQTLKATKTTINLIFAKLRVAKRNSF